MQLGCVSHHRSPNVESCTRYFKDRVHQMLAEARTNERYLHHLTVPDILARLDPPATISFRTIPQQSTGGWLSGAKFQVVMETDPTNFPVVLGPVLRKFWRPLRYRRPYIKICRRDCTQLTALAPVQTTTIDARLSSHTVPAVGTVHSLTHCAAMRVQYRRVCVDRSI